MRPKSLVLLMLALGCGLVASIGISQVMERRGQPTEGETAPVVVAAENINANDGIKPELVSVVEWPVDKIPPGAISDLAALEGRRARTTLYQGLPIVEANISGSIEELEIPKGLRVVTVQVDAVSGGAGLMKPGDRVDMLLSVQRNPGAGIGDTGTKTILQDVRVFAVNEQWRRNSEGEDEAIAARTVSLLVTPPQAEKVTLATEMGKIRLVLRNPADEIAEDASGTKATDILDGMAEKANREVESQGLTGPSQQPPKTGDLLDFLKGGEPQAEEPAVAEDESEEEDEPQLAPAPVAPQQESFVMELLEGSSRRTVEFYRGLQDDAAWQNADGSGSSLPSPVEPQPKKDAVEKALEEQIGNIAPGLIAPGLE